MKKELEDRLFACYPKIFGQKDLPMTETCMCWGIDCGDGWCEIIDALCQSIQWHVDNEIEHQKIMREIRTKSLLRVIFVGFRKGWHKWYWWNDLPLRISNWNRYRKPFDKWLVDNNPQVEAVQVKEKFGGLRFYTNGYDEEVGGMIHMAEQWAVRTCEQCGEPGKQRGHGWIYTLCDKCAEKKKIS